MSILVTCAFKPSWCDFAQDRFIDMGMEVPKSAERNAISVEQLITKMCASQGSTHSAASFQLGRAWEIATADLFVANAEKPMWGWADHRNIHILEFLREFEPKCRFVLVYGSMPELLSAEFIAHDPKSYDFDRLVEEWRIYHDAMLRFYQLHPEQCILTHISAFQGTARPIADKIISKFNFPVRHTNTSKHLEHSWLETMLASQISNALISDNHLTTELDGSSDLADSRAAQPGIEAVSLAAQEFTTLKNHNTSLSQQIECLEDANQGKDKEIIILSSKLADSEKSLKELEEAGPSVTEEENQLLSAQLQQMQEELKVYFHKYQAAKEAMEAREQQTENQTPKEASAPQAVSSKPSFAQDEAALFIDFRSVIDGDHWYSAEPQGRWAGLRDTSKIRIGSLSPGTYRVQFRVADAMSLEHLYSLTIEANGLTASRQVKILSDIGGRLAPLRRLKARLGNVPNPYPAEVSAILPESAIVGKDRPLELVLRTCSPVSPSIIGGADARTLSICIESMKLTKVG